jgi:glycosyltransferase involved in cell wall biosynthesis
VNQPRPILSVVIPLHNEQPVIPELLRRTLPVLDSLEGGPHELVLVDDGSTDATLAILEDAAQRDLRILVVSLSRNFGHQAAITAGLAHTTGDAAVVLDGDLQDPPEAIPVLVQEFKKGYDVVYVQRTNRKEALYLRFCYWLFYRLLNWLSDLRLPVDSGDFGLMSRRVVQLLMQFPEHHRYLRGLRSWVGFRQVGVPIERCERAAGKSKYSALGLLKLASDGLLAFSIVPIRAAGLVGVGSMMATLLYAGYSVVVKLVLHQSPKGFTALTLLITFLAGINLLFLGIIGEYVGRIYEEAKARPLYIVGKLIRGGQEALPKSAPPVALAKMAGPF